MSEVSVEEARRAWAGRREKGRCNDSDIGCFSLLCRPQRWAQQRRRARGRRVADASWQGGGGAGGRGGKGLCGSSIEFRSLPAPVAAPPGSHARRSFSFTPTVGLRRLGGVGRAQACRRRARRGGGVCERRSRGVSPPGCGTSQGGGPATGCPLLRCTSGNKARDVFVFGPTPQFPSPPSKHKN